MNGICPHSACINARALGSRPRNKELTLDILILAYVYFGCQRSVSIVSTAFHPSFRFLVRVSPENPNI